MSIISKESFNKLTQEEKEKLRKLYSNSVKINLGIMAKIFPEEVLQPQPSTYEDVARELFKESALQADFYKSEYAFDTYPLNCISEKQAEKLLAINKLLNVAKFLNGDWKPDWENIHEYKWYIEIWENEINIDSAINCNGRIVYFRTKELAKQAVQILGEDTIRWALSTDW